MEETRRCPWAKSPLEIAYHDGEWGRPLHREDKLFEMLLLEGMQAGLSWGLILQKREGMRNAFLDFDPERLAAAQDGYLTGLLEDPGIVRNRLKVFSTRRNARAYLKLREERGGLDSYLWDWVDGKPIQNRFAAPEEIPAQTPLSGAISKDLKKRGFHFVGPTIVYALMQSAGLVNDHMVWCDWYETGGV